MLFLSPVVPTIAAMALTVYAVSFWDANRAAAAVAVFLLVCMVAAPVGCWGAWRIFHEYKRSQRLW